ncbi:uncharacterized protein LOC134816080 [Bolinopsis microptera]|uniref:uncharacterized protein LOC134816080 n=1 Tax=Bolinopsis microptera TaxID=2820187 RepID=UPI003078C98E
MIKCNWDSNFSEKVSFDDSCNSWKAEDLSISQSDEKDGSLELNVAVMETLCTCRTIELFSSSGYLKSIRGNVVEDDSYTLYQHKLEPETVSEVVRVKFLSNSYTPKTTVYFRKLILVPKAPATPGRQTSNINTAAVRELLKDLPHNEQSSSSVLSMMDNMPPLLSMLLPNNRLPPQLTALSRLQLEQPDSLNQNIDNGSSENGHFLGETVSDNVRTKMDKSSIDLSSILGSIGSLENVSALTEAFKKNNLSNNDQSTTSSREMSKLHAEQKIVKDDISKLRTELDATKKELLKAVAESESRSTELLLRVLEEIKSSR